MCTKCDCVPAVVFAQELPKHLLFNLDHFVYYPYFLIPRKKKVMLIHYFLIDGTSWSCKIFVEKIWHADVKKLAIRKLCKALV